jgi:hypothetical protein
MNTTQPGSTRPKRFAAAMSVLVLSTFVAACQTTTGSLPARDRNSTTSLLDSYYDCLLANKSQGREAALEQCRSLGMKYAQKVAKDNGVASKHAQYNAEKFILPEIEKEMGAIL